MSLPVNGGAWAAAACAAAAAHIDGDGGGGGAAGQEEQVNKQLADKERVAAALVRRGVGMRESDVEREEIRESDSAAEIFRKRTFS